MQIADLRAIPDIHAAINRPNASNSRSRSDVITMLYESHPPRGNISYEFWVMATDPGQTYLPLISYASKDHENWWMFSLIPGKSGVQAKVWAWQNEHTFGDGDRGLEVYQNDTEFETPTWVHIAVTVSTTGKVSMYINGEFHSDHVVSASWGKDHPVGGLWIIGQVCRSTVDKLPADSTAFAGVDAIFPLTYLMTSPIVGTRYIGRRVR